MRKLRKFYIIIGIILIFVAIGAIPAGLSMILEPDGKGLGIPVEWLNGSPFHNFFIPGFFLFTVNGLISLTAGILSFFRFRYTAVNAMVLGVFMIAWIIIQVLTIGLVSFMQPMFFIIGLAEVLLGIILIRKLSNLK